MYSETKNMNGMRVLLIVLVMCITSVIYAQFNQVDHGFLLDGVPAGTSSGISWYDFDGDGWDDLTVGQGNREILVYRNVQGTLQLFYAFANTTQVKSFQWVDFDNDNDADFFICAANASCKLLRNDGNMVFTDVLAKPQKSPVQSISAKSAPRIQKQLQSSVKSGRLTRMM